MKKTMDTMEMQKRLAVLQAEFEELGLEYFVVIAMPHTQDGASIYNGRNLSKGAATNARNAHMVWEKKNGIDTEHDWALESIKPVWKKW